eukprot:m51a1_g10426 hypothetical protein (83) ;mRNA; r:23298-23771
MSATWSLSGRSLYLYGFCGFSSLMRIDVATGLLEQAVLPSRMCTFCRQRTSDDIEQVAQDIAAVKEWIQNEFKWQFNCDKYA